MSEEKSKCCGAKIVQAPDGDGLMCEKCYMPASIPKEQVTPEPKLLPCPFCGGEVVRDFVNSPYRRDISCAKCGESFDMSNAQWNTRTETQRLEERVRGLEQKSAEKTDNYRQQTEWCERLVKERDHNKRMWEGQINRTKLTEQELLLAHAQIAVLRKKCLENNIAVE